MTGYGFYVLLAIVIILSAVIIYGAKRYFKYIKNRPHVCYIVYTIYDRDITENTNYKVHAVFSNKERAEDMLLYIKGMMHEQYMEEDVPQIIQQGIIEKVIR